VKIYITTITHNNEKVIHFYNAQTLACMHALTMFMYYSNVITRPLEIIYQQLIIYSYNYLHQFCVAIVM